MQQPGIYNTGTALTVGSHQVVIDKYFSHGGFAQVYTCQISPPWQNGITTACLKRVLVPDKSSLNTLRKEVDAMRKLQGIACIVSYIDSHAARSHNGNGPGYEVFVLMEYCPNKGLIDFMNSRLTDKLKEFEILNIMQQITEAVAHMHTLNPVLIHRDIKIENVLLGNENGVFKLCDFGSVSTIIQPASNIEEFQRIQDDIMKNTTPQYRAPEMLDLYKRQPINEKSDIWALGVFLYKLCFYTTPFEANAINGNLNGYNGDYAIINGIYSLPSNPHYSARLKNIITKMLVVDPKMRPNAFQLLEEICKLRGVPTPKIINPLSNNLQPIMMSSNLSSSSVANSNMANQNYNDANDTTLNGAKNLVSGQPYAFNSSTVKPVMVSPFKVNNPPYVSANNNIMTTPKRKVRPLSMYGHVDLNKSVSRDESVKNFMNEIATEQIVDLSPEGKSKDNQKQTDIHRNVSSSMDFIRSISRQNTNSSIHSRGRLDNDTGDGNNGTTLERTLSYSKHKKRSSITSIKSFITGGSMKTQPNSSSTNTMAPNNYNPGSKLTPQHSRSSSLRKSFGYSTKRNSSVDSLPPEPTLKFKHLNNSLADLKEMSPESKSTIKFPNMNSTSNSDSSKRNSSIQSRVKNLFRNASPPPVKTAQGYGKYTDEKPKIEPSAPKSIGLTDKGNFTPNIMHYPTAPNSIKSVYSKNSQLSSKNSFPESSGSTVSTNADTESSHSKDTNKLKKSTTVLPVAKVDIGVLKAKKKPPPKPVKPSYLKSEAVNAVAGEDKRKSLIDDDLDVLEQNFKMRFPGIV